MGCSSSSAQTVDQEKKPGTKPEESNGGTLAVQNGIIAETIEDKMQLPVSDLADDLQQEADDGAEAVLVVMEAQEDLGSGEDILTDLEPQPDPVSVEEPGSASCSSKASGDSTFADVAAEALDPLMAKPLSEEEIPAMGDSEIRQAEVPAEENIETCKTIVPVPEDDDVIKGEVSVVEEMKADRPTVDVEPVYAKVPAVVEQASAVPAGASPEVANPVVEPVVADTQEAVADVPDEVAPCLETATENSPLLPPLVRPESPASTEAAINEVEPPAGATPGDGSVEDRITAKSSEVNESPASTEAAINEVEPPAGATPGDASVEDPITAKSSEVKEATIDTGIAVATIPEMLPLVPVTDETQAEYTLAVEESKEALVMPSETVPQAEPSCPAESTAPQEPALVVLEVPVTSTLLLKTSSKEASEVPPAFGASSSSVAIDCAVEVPVPRPTQKEIEANSPVTAAEQVSEPSTQVSEAECHQDMEKEKAKKED
ncbi:calphotin-like isoform X2 [Phycodurus eques]|uniref:calphotin-like isoform X2 n=1 Tax=Phycodurus eques TaxID=693459 RepID=UPI002ACDB6AD|nr:calphotin-like isoform X2 [Phycodurus eques]